MPASKEKNGGIAEAVMADAGSGKDVAGLVDRAVATHGRLDVIWANAGVLSRLMPLSEQAV